ncbi:MAG TPA: glutamate-1-semialdehyde 2,1-aminomutase [Candidatus Udaeobacter sp.]|jgi:glutamate-1-semialdehyde 2,1-aminomutase|nr:glutamate-1-semialdehyde 2,1-aminomutase [Candidatus Udaeobacter sp.]
MKGGTTLTRAWSERAAEVTPGGVHSPVRAFLAVGAAPIAIIEGLGATVTDSAGKTYIDWIGAWGPALLGHAHAGIQEAVIHAARRGLLFGLASPAEVDLAERLIARVPGADMARFMATGTEAAMTAVRLARVVTGRAGVIKFAGGYHGHADAFLASAGSGVATLRLSAAPGVTEGAIADTLIARLNDLDSVDRAFDQRRGEIAAILVEPVAGNMGCVPPETGFLAGLRERCDRHGAVLILDEIITGLRIARGGAAERYGVTADLSLLGKALGGGMPLAAVVGRREIMSRLAPSGPVYQAGTYAAHPLAIAAALATLDALDAEPQLYAELEARGARLERGLREAAASAGIPLQLQRVGSMWTAFFADRPVRSWDDAEQVDRERYAKFFRALLERGVLLPPSAFECAFLSRAHGDREIDATLAAARAAFAEIAS